MRPDNQWMSLPAAARLLGRSNKALKRAADRGAIPVQRIPGSHLRIATRVVSELIAGSYEPAGSPARLREPKIPDAVSVRLAKPVGA
jgi:hypothetical protein